LVLDATKNAKSHFYRAAFVPWEVDALKHFAKVLFYNVTTSKTFAKMF